MTTYMTFRALTAWLYAGFITYEEGCILKNKRKDKNTIGKNILPVSLVSVALVSATLISFTISDGALFDFSEKEITINYYYENKDKVVPKEETASSEDSDVKFTTETYVRLADSEDRTWKESVDAKIGDKVEFRIGYKNTSDKQQNDVAIKDILPSNLKYVDGTTVLKNSSHPNGAIAEHDYLVKNGTKIGSYGPGANAYVYFDAEVVDEDLEQGLNTLTNWAQAGVGEVTIQDYADVIVNIPKQS